MTIELSDDELAIISDWYHSAAGESASGLSVSPLEDFKEEYKYRFYEEMKEAKRVKAFVDKLGFKYADSDEYAMKKVGLL